MADPDLRTALIVSVPEATPTVDAWRERTCYAKPSAGVPPHVTVLFPFVPASLATDELLGELQELFASLESFPITLERTARFETVLYLAPREPEPFVRLTTTVVHAYPRHPPYGGTIDVDDLVPHLTVAEGDTGTLDEAEAEIRGSLPLTNLVVEVLLLEELEPDAARWRARAVFPLRSPARATP